MTIPSCSSAAKREDDIEKYQVRQWTELFREWQLQFHATVARGCWRKWHEKSNFEIDHWNSVVENMALFTDGGHRTVLQVTRCSEIYQLSQAVDGGTSENFSIRTTVANTLCYFCMLFLRWTLRSNLCSMLKCRTSMLKLISGHPSMAGDNWLIS